MFEPAGNQNSQTGGARRLQRWAFPVVLLAMSLALAFHYGSLARQDAAIAPRQQVAVGTMLKLTHGKYTTAWYSFTVAGRQYRGKGTVSPSHCFCDVTVYFDPSNPAMNSLVEYKRKTWADHITMSVCLWLSAAFAALLVLALVKRSSKPQPNYSQVS